MSTKEEIHKSKFRKWKGVKQRKVNPTKERERQEGGGPDERRRREEGGGAKKEAIENSSRGKQNKNIHSGKVASYEGERTERTERTQRTHKHFHSSRFLGRRSSRLKFSESFKISVAFSPSLYDPLLIDWTSLVLSVF